MSRVLVVDDDAEFGEVIAQALRDSGFESATAPNAEAAVAMLPGADVAIVDVMMPGASGFEMVASMRSQGDETPVLFLTSKDQTTDLVDGLSYGGDDYLVKPCRLDELIARIKSLLRRSKMLPPPLRWTDFEVRYHDRTASRRGRILPLSPTEFALLERLLQSPGCVVSKGDLIEAIWGEPFARDENNLEIFIGYLRRKTEAFGGSRVIHTVRGKGYVLADKPLES